MPASRGAAGAWGRPVSFPPDGGSHAASLEELVPSALRRKGLVSYASRLMFSRCFGEMLSEVMLPPHPPQPSVIDGSRLVVRPIDPSVVGVLTTMRKAGFLSPNSRITSSFREWMDIVCPIPPYRRICLHRSQPSFQSD